MCRYMYVHVCLFLFCVTHSIVGKKSFILLKYTHLPSFCYHLEVSRTKNLFMGNISKKHFFRAERARSARNPGNSLVIF